MIVKAVRNKKAEKPSFLLSPHNIIENMTKPSIFNSSGNTSFDMNMFSLNEEEASGYYALVSPDGTTNSYLKLSSPTH